MTHGSLFSGIGGFELGAEMAGIETVWSCEIEAWNRKLLKQKFPNTIQYDDIRSLTRPSRVDIISGGFPCQDISNAGKMVGLDGERSGLWGEMFRVICDVRPKYVIIENSPNLAFLGLDRVLSGLASAGYDAEWQTISNHAFGFPHWRKRIYIIAYSVPRGLQVRVSGHGGVGSVFREWTPNQACGLSFAQRIHQIPTHPNMRNGDGVSNWVQRVGGLGNAVNPAVARYLFECIKLHT